MALDKKKRIVNKALVSKVRELGCFVCGWKPCDAHHVRSRGAGGGDTEENLLALCRRHHSEIHQIGKTKFFSKYKTLQCYNKKG